MALIARQMIALRDIPSNFILGYSDCNTIKSHPVRMLKALELLGEPVAKVISFGDRVIDIQASNATGIESVACFRCTNEKTELLNSICSQAMVHPCEILTLIR